MDTGFSYPFFEGFLLDVSNYLICILVFYILLKRKIISFDLFILFSVFSLTPFFFNNVLISWTEFYDQKKYLVLSDQFRSTFFNEGTILKKREGLTLKVYLTSFIYSLFPVVNFYSINSIAFINKLIFCLTMTYMYHRNIFSKNYVILLFIFPSIIFFSSFSLRDTLILSIMLLILGSYLNKNYTLSIILSFLLIIIKLQNFIFVIAIISFTEYYKYTKKNKDIKIHIFSLVAIFVILLSNLGFILEKINFFREGLFSEEFGEYKNTLSPLLYQNYFKIDLNLNSLYLLFISIINFLFSPISKIDSFMSVVALFEIFMFVFLFFIIYQKYKKKKNKLFFFLALTIFLSLVFVYSLLIFNEITFIRYRYPIILFFLSYLYSFNRVGTK